MEQHRPGFPETSLRLAGFQRAGDRSPRHDEVRLVDVNRQATEYGSVELPSTALERSFKSKPGIFRPVDGKKAPTVQKVDRVIYCFRVGDRFEYFEGSPVGPRRIELNRFLVELAQLPQSKYFQVQRPCPKLSVASQALGHCPLGPVDRILEPSVRDELAGKFIIGLDRAWKSVDFRLQVGHLSACGVRRHNLNGSPCAGTANDTARTALVENSTQLIDLGMDLGLAGTGRSMELGQCRPRLVIVAGDQQEVASRSARFECCRDHEASRGRRKPGHVRR